MNKIPTAEEFIQQFAQDFKTKYEGNGGTVKNLMIEFGKLCAQAALKEASKVLEVNSDGDYIEHPTSEKILNAYPLTNIK